jgi:amino acid transporter
MSTHPAGADPGTPANASAGELHHGVLGLPDALAQSVALLSLAIGVAFAASGAAADAGAAAPLTYVVAAVGALCLGSVIIRFTRRIASVGGVYTYIARGLGPSSGFIGGWLYGAGFAVGISFVLAISSTFLSTVFKAHTSLKIGWFPFFLIMLAALLVLSVLQIRVSTRTQLALAAVGIVSILVLSLIVLAKGGASGVSLQPFNPSRVPSSSSFFLGVVLAFTGYIGFEAAAVLGEETADPRRAIPRAILVALVFGTVFYVFVTWTMSLGFGINHSAAWAQNPSALDTLATRYAGTWLSIIVDLSVAASGFVAALGGLHLTARTLLAMGRDGGLPRSFATVHPRYGSPWVGIVVSIVITLVLGAWLGNHYGPFTFFAFLATTASLAILLVYIMVAGGGAIFFWRSRAAAGQALSYNVVLDVLLPALAIAICGYTIYKSIEPVPPHPIDLAPYIAGAWLLLGLAVLFWLRARQPDRVARFGQALGAGEAGEEHPEPHVA